MREGVRRWFIRQVSPRLWGDIREYSDKIQSVGDIRENSDYIQREGMLL